MASRTEGGADKPDLFRNSAYSSLRENTFEHLLLGELGIELMLRGIEFSILRSTSDRDGYDVVVETDALTRHIQCKASIVGGSTRDVTVNGRLARRPCGCVVWMIFDPETRRFSELLWFGGAPGKPLPSLGSKPARHTRGDKNVREGSFELGKGKFTKLTGISMLADQLFGPVP